MPLHPQVEAYLKSIADLPPVWSLPVDEARRNYNAAAPLNAGPLDEVAQIEDRLLPGPEGEDPEVELDYGEMMGSIISGVALEMRAAEAAEEAAKADPTPAAAAAPDGSGTTSPGTKRSSRKSST